MIFIPKQKDDSPQHIEQLLLLSSYPRNENDLDAREEFLNRLNQVSLDIQFQFMKKFLYWIVKKHFVILLNFYMTGNLVPSKQIKTAYNDTI